jgi:hypothetical protein
MIGSDETRAGEASHDGRGAPVQEVAYGGEPIRVASVDDDVVPVVEQGLRRRAPEAVCRAGHDPSFLLE